MKKLSRTTIQHMPVPNSKNKFKYCFEMRHYGGEQREELEAWCLSDPENRRWGNMGYVECNKDSDAIEFITTWGINCARKVAKPSKVLDKETVAKLGYSRVGLKNI